MATVLEFPTLSVTLAGDLSEDKVEEVVIDSACKSWLYLNPETHAACPKASLAGHNSIKFMCVPVDGAALTPKVADDLMKALDSLPKPTVIQCSTATRAGVALILHLAKTRGLGASSAIQLAKELKLSFTTRPALTNFVKDSLSKASKTIFRQLFEQESSTYTYLIGDLEDMTCCLIDPVLETVDRDLEVISDLGLELTHMFNTHCHADHITGTGTIKEKLLNAKSVIARASTARADIHIEDKEIVTVSKNIQIEVRATPGHTDGCVTYVFDDCAFTGDALLIRGCGRTDFQGGSSAKLYESVHGQIFTLPDFTKVFPAHDYKGRMMSTVGEEKACNPRLGSGKTKEEFIQIMENLNLAYPKKIDVSLPRNLMCGYER